LPRTTDLLLTAIAPAVWGSTYIVTTELLPPGYPLTVAMLRALPAGLLLLLLVRQLPKGIWWHRSLVLGALNFSFFWAMLFVAAYRLPGGVAATVGAIQPLVVLGLSRVLMGTVIRPLAILASVAGIGGVALLALTPAAGLDPIGIAAGLAGGISMALAPCSRATGRGPVSRLTVTPLQPDGRRPVAGPLALGLKPGWRLPPPKTLRFC